MGLPCPRGPLLTRTSGLPAQNLGRRQKKSNQSDFGHRFTRSSRSCPTYLTLLTLSCSIRGVYQRNDPYYPAQRTGIAKHFSGNLAPKYFWNNGQLFFFNSEIVCGVARSLPVRCGEGAPRRIYIPPRTTFHIGAPFIRH